ncbi:hypothetical protein QO002_006316 [Pararhizobium capsulatum DSM 1112]|uniref:Uncharacterized protein n=1 Tax=Pararhizobium capsulatum DSM 1112 TaxID=1121113 RepID=A0ABU0C0S9_9HYPH|nr:hypothetical protein [Pararhizobium capsulatum DSM 1112]
MKKRLSLLVAAPHACGLSKIGLPIRKAKLFRQKN